MPTQSSLPAMLVKNRLVFCQRLTGVLVFSCGLGVAGIAAWLIVIGYSPTPFADQWGTLFELASGKHWFSPAWLWAQSNEHRIPLVRLAAIADLKLFGGHSIFLFTLIYATLMLHWGAWTAFIKTTVDVPRFVWLSVAGFFAFCIFCPSQIENFYWALQWTFVASFFFSSLSFLSLVWFSTRGRAWNAILFSSVSAFASESSLASGMLTWPILWLAATQLPLTRKQITTLIGIGMTCGAAYLYHYQRPGSHSDPLVSIRQPGRIAQYVSAYIGHPLSFFVTYPRFTAIILSLLALASLSYLLRQSSTRNLALALAMTMGFILAIGTITALGRLKFGIAQAESSRYQTPVMLYWACAFTALLLTAAKNSSWRDILTLNFLALAVMLLPLRNLLPMAETVRIRANLISSIGEALDQGIVDPSEQDQLLAGMFAVLPGTMYLHRLGDKIVPGSTLLPPGQFSTRSLGSQHLHRLIHFIDCSRSVLPGPESVSS